MGREPAPYDNGIMSLLEYSNAIYSRALEINMLLHQAERQGNVSRGDPYYKFRTGELRDFIDIAKGACELGSRRLTAAQLLMDMREEMMP